MQQRNLTDIKIYRTAWNDEGGDYITRVVATVPITDDSTRRFKLMEEDCVVLQFDLAEAVVSGGVSGFQIGDYIVDELFGSFQITEEPTPAEYNYESGAYRYELRFDREYIGWKNTLFMLTYNGSNGAILRKEANWSLTDNLAGHVNELMRNFESYGYDYSFDSEEVASFEEVVFIEYNGASIFDALNKLAEVYHCEWWVAEEIEQVSWHGVPINRKVNRIHFGKCENGSAVALRLGENVEQITPSRNDNEYANRIYAFGSTNNIPETYRKKIIFTVTDYDPGVDRFQDANHPLDATNFGLDSIDIDLPASWQSGSADTRSARMQNQFTVANHGYYNIKIGFILQVYGDTNGSPLSSKFKVRLFLDSIADNSCIFEEDMTGVYTKMWGYGTDTTFHPFEVSAQSSRKYLSKGSHQLYLVVECQDDTFTLDTSTYAYAMATGNYGGGPEMSLTPVSIAVQIGILFGGIIHPATLNPSPSPNNANSNWIEFEYVRGLGLPTINKGDSFEIYEQDINDSPYDLHGLDVYTIPASYYSSESAEDIESLKLLGERRLMLPEGTLFVGDKNLDKRQIVEKVVIFDEIYPKCALRITDISTRIGTITIESEDGSSRKENFTQYIIKAKRITETGDVDFPFLSKYLTPTPLQIKFLTKSEELNYSSSNRGSENGYVLSGMTFDVEWSDDNGTFTIAWNEDYGAQLPNSNLPPTVGDPFILIGWDVRGMSSLGLVSTAEQQLADAAEAYLDAIEDEQFTFDCDMMSDWIFANGLLEAGRRVVVYHDALRNAKSTRVIGYEYNLAQPFNTPKYTVGETDAYSRLKDLERAVGAQSQGSVNGSMTGTVGGSGGGGSSVEVLNRISELEAATKSLAEADSVLAKKDETLLLLHKTLEKSAFQSVEQTGPGNVVTSVSPKESDPTVLVIERMLNAMKTVPVTQEEYNLLNVNGLCDPKTWYCVYSDAAPNPLMAVYIGDTLFAKRESGSAGFPYNFPIIF